MLRNGSIVMLTALVLLVAGCTKNNTPSTTPESEKGSTAASEPAAAEPAPADKPAEPAAGTTDEPVPTGKPVVELSTSMGTIKMELYPDKAPKSVQNFLAYVKAGHYDGTIFHRVIDGFMVQGGGFDAQFNKKPTRAPVQNEADNGLKNEIGTVALARTMEPHSASAQFFINVANNDFLNHRDKTVRGWGYTVFGKVIEGMDVVNKIKNVPTGPKGPFPKDVPQTEVTITSAKVID